MIEAPSSAYRRGMLSLAHSHSHEEETFYVAVFVKPFLSSFWSAVVLCSRKYFSLRRCDFCSGRSHAWGIPASNDLLSGSASVHRPPDPACAYGTWRAPWWTTPSHDRAATRTLSPLELPTPISPRDRLHGERRTAALRAAPSGTTPVSIHRHKAMSSLRATATIPIRRQRLLPCPKRC